MCGLVCAQAIPKFKSHYVRYYDLEQISRESVEESRALQEGATLRYLQACQQCRSRGSARGAACSSKTGPELPAAAYFAKALEQELTRVRRYADIFSEETWVRLGSVVDSLSKVATPRAVGEFLAEENLQNLTGVCHEIGKEERQLHTTLGPGRKCQFIPIPFFCFSPNEDCSGEGEYTDMTRKSWIMCLQLSVV